MLYICIYICYICVYIYVCVCVCVRVLFIINLKINHLEKGLNSFCIAAYIYKYMRNISIIHLRCIREVLSDALSSLPISGYFCIISAPTVTPA